MREIKFRAWDTFQKHMWQWEELQTFNGDSHLKTYFTDSDNIVLQYTGLKDKNGVEIYEGDIVKTENNLASGFSTEPIHVGAIAYQRAEYIVKVGIIGTSLSILTGAKWGIEVIGNIYENPELLT